jgi:hypothetical protein
MRPQESSVNRQGWLHVRGLRHRSKAPQVASVGGPTPSGPGYRLATHFFAKPRKAASGLSAV